MFNKNQPKGCHKCGVMTRLFKRKGYYKLVCKSCMEKLENYK